MEFYRLNLQKSEQQVSSLFLSTQKVYLNAFSTEPKPEALVRGLGTTWEILQNGFKYFPTILASHSPIQATLAIVRKRAIDPRKIARITNETYNTVKTHFSNKDVSTVMAARVSVPYCIAVAAVDGELTQKQFSPARLADPLVREVLNKTEVIADAELNALYPDKFPARVTITLNNGKSFQETIFSRRGSSRSTHLGRDRNQVSGERKRGAYITTGCQIVESYLRSPECWRYRRRCRTAAV